MADIDDLRARIERLEAHVAHQEATIEDLNATVTAHWGKLDAALRQLALLDDRLHEAEAQVGAVVPQQRPPHY